MEPKRLERRQIPTIPNDGRGLRSLPAWALSLVFHVSIITLLGVFWVARPSGTGGQSDRPIGIAVVYKSAGQENYYLNGDGQSNTSDAASNLQNLLPSAEVSNAAEAAESALISDLVPGSSSAGADTGSAAGAFGLGDGGGSLGGSGEAPKVKTTVFGIEGEGSRFLYVFDRSDSMNGYGGAPIQSAKSELLKSLESLGPSHQFQIIFYNDSPLPFGGLNSGTRLLRGDDKDKTAAQRFVRDVAAVGGTQHIDALRMAMRMNPDVIFFLTDADAAPPSQDIERLHSQAARIGATIHTIQFGRGSNQSGGGWIEYLATQSGGKYRYIDVSKLRTQ
ncbi:MAG: hypothetical protein ACE361_00385 [Aureliella sp.]